MAEVVYSILEFSGTISKKTFRDITNELDSKGFNLENTMLSEEHLKVFISLLFVYGFHYDAVLIKQRPLFLKAVFDEKLPLLDISKKFCLHLLNNLDTAAQTELNELQKMQHNLLDPFFSNERLLDFVEIELMDVSESYRKWEYGHFVAENLSKNLFKNSKWDKAKQSIEQNPYKLDEFLRISEKQMDKTGDGLNPQETLFLQLMAKAKLNPDKVNMADYLVISNIFQRNIFSLSLKIEKLVNVLDNAIKSSKFKGKGKGGQRL